MSSLTWFRFRLVMEYPLICSLTIKQKMGVFFAGAHEIIPNKILIIHSCLLSPFNDGGA